MSTDHDEEDEHEPPVPVNAVPEVQVVGKGSTVDHVENLTEDERVEHQGTEGCVVLGGLASKNVVSPPVKDETDDDLVTGLTENHLDHVDVEQGRRSLLGQPVQRSLRSGVGCEGESGEGVHDQVDPEQLDGGQDRLFLVGGNGGDKCKDDGGDVDGKLELQELSDGVVDTSTPLDGEDQRSERVVHNDNVGSLLGDLGTADTHGETDLSGLEGGSIVGTVTSDTNSVAQLAEGLDQQTLVLGRGSGHDLKTGDDLETFGRAETTEGGSFDDDSTGRVHATLGSDRSSSKNVVTGAHLDGNTGLVALGNRLDDSRTKRVLDGNDGDHDEVLGKVGKSKLSLTAFDGEGTGLVVLVTNGDGSEALRSIEVDGPLQVGHGLLVEGDHVDVIRTAARDIDVDVGSADLEQDFGGTLDEQPDLSVGKVDSGSHGLDLTAEGENLVDGSSSSSLGGTGPSLLTTEQEHGGLGLGTNDDGLARLLVDILESGRVDSEGVVEELGHLRTGEGAELVQVEGKVLSALTGVLGLDHTMLISDLVGVGSTRVLFQSSDTLGSDTKRHGDDLHLVQGKSTGLVGADDTGTSGSLTRSQNTNKQVLLGHSLGSKGQSQSDSQGETLGDGDNDQGDGDNEDTDKGLTLLVGSPVGVLLELDAESDEQGEEESTTSSGTELGDELGKSVELHLQRSRLGLGSEGWDERQV